LARDRDEAKVSHRRAVSLRVAIDHDSAQSSQRGRACAGQPDDSGTDNRKVKDAGDGRLRTYDLLVL
jgi:hypothetical protein